MSLVPSSTAGVSWFSLLPDVSWRRADTDLAAMGQHAMPLTAHRRDAGSVDRTGHGVDTDAVSHDAGASHAERERTVLQRHSGRRHRCPAVQRQHQLDAVSERQRHHAISRQADGHPRR